MYNYPEETKVFTYEDKSDELDEMLEKYRPRWRLHALAWINYEDVRQIIRLHIWNKWHLWNQEKSFKPWASTVISNQMMNLVRNHYTNFAKPCLKCSFYQGGEGCGLTQSGNQDEECDLFAKWKKKKERAYNLKLALPIEDGVELGESSITDDIDFDKSSDKLHNLVMAQLPEKHALIYRLIYIEHKEDEEVAEICKFKKDPSKRNVVRYKQINNLKKKFYEIAKQVMEDNDIL
jgi:RNA polymerase sigma factor (sigma-70 family)